MKKLLLAILLVLLTAPNCFCALAATTIYEIQQAATAGNVNGCGFNPSNAAVGTDRSQTATAYKDHNDLHTDDGDSNPTLITSAAHPFTSDDNGNLIHITAGTNWTAGWYEIVSVDGSNVATLDRAASATNGELTGGTYYLGGACSGGSSDDAVFELAGAVWYIKYDASNPTITSGASVAIAQDGTALLPKYIVGYVTTRTINNTDSDANIALRETWNTGGNYVFNPGDHYRVRNLIFTSTASTSTITAGSGNYFYNVKISNTTATADKIAITAANNTNVILLRCELISTAGTAGSFGSNVRFIGGYVHDSKIGISLGALAVAANSIIETNSSVAITLGSAADGIVIIGNTLYGVNSGDTGILGPDNETSVFVNNTLSNFATAINFTTETKGNIYDFNNYDTDTTTNVTQGPHDVNVSPTFTDASGANFSLTGTELANKGAPGLVPGSATTSTSYIGAWQKNSTSSGGGAWAQ